MKAFVITIKGNEVSETAAQTCIDSSKIYKNDFDVETFDAITPPDVDRLLLKNGIKWNYPWEGQVVDFTTGLTKKAYPTENKKARVACALSHYSLWTACAHGAIPYLVMEHDAIFTAKLDYKVIEKTKKLIISINNPLYATRKAREYKDKIENSTPDQQGVVHAPYIDEMSVPQGLPGNSAYIIKPDGAQKMIDLVKEYGLWPNDALMCRQLIPNIGCTKKFYTRVQGTRSTTTF